MVPSNAELLGGHDLVEHWEHWSTLLLVPRAPRGPGVHNEVFSKLRDDRNQSVAADVGKQPIGTEGRGEGKGEDGGDALRGDALAAAAPRRAAGAVRCAAAVVPAAGAVAAMASAVSALRQFREHIELTGGWTNDPSAHVDIAAHLHLAFPVVIHVTPVPAPASLTPVICGAPPIFPKVPALRSDSP